MSKRARAAIMARVRARYPEEPEVSRSRFYRWCENLREERAQRGLADIMACAAGDGGAAPPLDVAAIMEEEGVAQPGMARARPKRWKMCRTW